MITLNWAISGSLNFADLGIKQMGGFTAPDGNRRVKRSISIRSKLISTSITGL